MAPGLRLSGMLFNIAVNDIFKVIETCIGKCLYVEDLTFFSAAMIIYKLQRAVNKITERAANVGFRFSVAKTLCKRVGFLNPILSINGAVS